MDPQENPPAQNSENAAPRDRRGWWARHRATLHAVGFIVALLVAAPTGRTLLVGLPLILIGVAIRTWSMGYLLKDAQLCTAGPYGYVRNPLYLGSLFILAGVVVAANCFPLTVVAVLVTALTYALTMRSEEALLTEAFGQAYLEYCAQTPRLLPWRGRVMPLQGQRFTWERLFNNNGHEFAGWVILLVILLGLKAAAGAHWGWWPYGASGVPLTYGIWWRGL